MNLKKEKKIEPRTNQLTTRVINENVSSNLHVPSIINNYILRNKQVHKSKLTTLIKRVIINQRKNAYKKTKTSV